MSAGLVLENFIKGISMIYRTSRRKLEIDQNLERLADETAELEQIAQDIDICFKAQEAEVRLRTKGINVDEREYLEEAKQFVDDLIKKIEKNAQERKEKWGKRMKLAAGLFAATTAVTALGYGVSKISSIREWYYDRVREAEQAERLSNKNVNIHLRSAADIDCDRFVSVKEFYSFYKEATGKDFFHQSLDVDKYVYLNVEEDTKSKLRINIGRSSYSSSTYKITLPPSLAEQFLQKGSTRSCSNWM